MSTALGGEYLHDMSPERTSWLPISQRVLLPYIEIKSLVSVSAAAAHLFSMDEHKENLPDFHFTNPRHAEGLPINAIDVYSTPGTSLHNRKWLVDPDNIDLAFVTENCMALLHNLQVRPIPSQN